jgi:hypothetical protein
VAQDKFSKCVVYFTNGGGFLEKNILQTDGQRVVGACGLPEKESFWPD